jgi:hypothetical protein
MRLYHWEYRYRVAVVFHVSISGEEMAYIMGEEPTKYAGMTQQVHASEVHEYKTIEAAKACEERLLAQGKHVIFQTAKVIWMTPEELDEEIAKGPQLVE